MSAMSCFGVALMVFSGVLLAWALHAPDAMAYSMALAGPRVAAGSDHAYLIGSLSGLAVGLVCAIVGTRGNKQQLD